VFPRIDEFGKAVGTHSGIVHVLDFHGNRVKSYRPHTVSVNDICIDSDGEFVATAAADGALPRVENPSLGPRFWLTLTRQSGNSCINFN